MSTSNSTAEEDKVERYIWGLPDSIQGNVTFAGPIENKRRLENNPRDNHAQQPPYKRQNITRAYTAGPGGKSGYAGNLPLSLIPLGHGNFDVIVVMDWLSKRKFVIVYHEKVVSILLEGDEIRRVHGERTQGVVKTSMNTKVVEFHIDLVHEVTPVAKSPYRLAPSKMQELSEQLQEFEKTRIELFSDYECEIRYHPGKANVVADALSRKERVKPRRVRAMAMTIQSRVKEMILAAQGEAFKQ
ncbi:hypothetical protein Tco_0840093 [Tanacetum coccineum]|uniref:Reverse transcriptase domain-containing protein n=1 Tax=Tanacetum coccineum TaxID=301880 RepID=A0ABQ5ASI6_9ASTR